MIAVDTGVWIDYLRVAQTPHANRLGEELRAGRDIAITDIVPSLERCVFWMTRGHEAVNNAQGGVPPHTTNARPKKRAHS